jgi:hypothetical protein
MRPGNISWIATSRIVTEAYSTLREAQEARGVVVERRDAVSRLAALAGLDEFAFFSHIDGAAHDEDGVVP